jgi:2,4-dienoyl-CoA reductase-like NADH-dependent reductase (Old Yellow Enzyme family)
MKTLFDTTTINGMELRNRFVRSATWEGMCDEHGRPSPKLAECYRLLARGNVGLIITGYTFVRIDGKQTRGSIGAHSDDLAPELKQVADAVHAEGGKLCMQLVHTGGQARVSSGTRLLAPSAVEMPHYTGVPEEMNKDDIGAVTAAFAESARRARDWGFDAVQIHAAHGYLINQFLSPDTNRRTDVYGGGIENRCRFMLEVYDRVRTAVGAKFPVIAKLNGSDFLPGGLAIDDAIFAARALDTAGIDAIEVSGGTPASGENTPVRKKIENREQEAYHLPLADRIKASVNCRVMVVGGFRSFDLVKQAIEQNDLDYVALARPFVREPDLVQRWKSGEVRRSRCISCNGCYRPGLREGGIYCIAEKTEQQKARCN